jgi:lysozyme family protein
MSNVAKAIDVVLNHEGGFVDNRSDKGGPTNFGITLFDLQAWRPGATLDDLKNLNRGQAQKYYLEEWWARGGYEGITSSRIAIVLFDQAVVSGTPSAVARVQALLGVRVDGLLGPTTLSALNSEVDDRGFSVKFLRACCHHYEDIVSANSSQIVFLSGWLDRVWSLLDVVLQ